MFTLYHRMYCYMLLRLLAFSGKRHALLLLNILAAIENTTSLGTEEAGIASIALAELMTCDYKYPLSPQKSKGLPWYSIPGTSMFCLYSTWIRSNKDDFTDYSFLT